MKILIVNSSDIQGGSARAAYRLHRALLDAGVDSQMLVQSKNNDDYTVIGSRTKVQKVFAKLRPTFDSLPMRLYKNRIKVLFSQSWVPFGGIVDRINELNPDIVHLHWICGGMMRIEDVARIKVPIVWSLHDMWVFTDGYHYDSDFDIQNHGLPSEPKLMIKKKIAKRKAKTYKNIKSMTIIGLSAWLNDCSKNSALLGGKRHINLPNLIDTKVFSSFDKQQARSLFNLPADKKLVLFGAMGATSDPRKGFKELLKALEYISAEYELIVFGSSVPKEPQGFKQKAYYLGNLHDDVSLRILYSAADVMVVPSLQENLSNTIMESLACGVPVIGFDIGGNSDLIEHKKNGYLAKPYETQDLAQGVKWVLNNHNYDSLCNNARKKIITEFDSKVVVKKYIELYKGIINQYE